MSSKFSTPFMNKSPLRDAKFLTTLQPRVMNPEENINLTSEELSEERDALADNVAGGITLNPTFLGLGTAAKGVGATAKAVTGGGFRNLVKNNVNKIMAFLGKKAGVKGGTTGVQATKSSQKIPDLVNM
jgi:hypothetical protein